MNNKKFISPEIEKNTIEELSKQLIKANSELRKLQDEREIMFANISHDLRAPMTAIRSAVDLVLSEDNPTREELLSTIELIDRRSKTLESLVNDMYFLYSVSNVPKAFELEEIEAAPFLEEYFFDLKTDSRFEAFDMVLDIEQGMDCVINIDVQKMIRVLDNLFTMAQTIGSLTTVLLDVQTSMTARLGRLCVRLTVVLALATHQKSMMALPGTICVK